MSSSSAATLRLSPFDQVLADFKAGHPVVIVDDEHRENEGDVVIATDRVTPENVGFMMREARGLICVSLSVELARKLNLPLQALNNNSVFGTPFAISIDHVAVQDRGVTAQARAFTMRQLVAAEAQASDFVSPGHVFPLIASPAGVLGRQGQTEGSYDLARICGFSHSGILCEILNPDGTMARGSDLEAFADRHRLLITSVQEIIKHRISEEVLVREVASAELETRWGRCLTKVFYDDVDGKEHVAVLFGNYLEKPLLRLHSECLTGDVFGSRRCDCGSQLAAAMERMASEARGMLLYLRQEGRGIGLANKLKAYALQDLGSDTVEANLELGFKADQRDYAVAAKILQQLGVSDVRLMTNNPDKLATLKAFGVNIIERVPIYVSADEYSKHYLETKRLKLGHLLPE